MTQGKRNNKYCLTVYQTLAVLQGFCGLQATRHDTVHKQQLQTYSKM